MRPRHFFLLVCLFGLHSVLHAEAPKTTTGAQPIFKCEFNGATIYLLGSIHLMKSSDYPLPPAFQEAYDKSHILVFETSVDQLETPEMQAKILELGIYSDGSTLKDHVSPKVYKEFTQYAAGSGAPVEILGKFKPWMAGLTLSVLEMQRLGFNPAEGIDRHFFALAKKDGKETRGFEEPMFQINLLASLDGKLGEEFLSETLVEIKTLPKELDDLIKAWKKGDMEKLSALLNKSMDKTPEIKEKLLLERNRNWIPAIDKLIQDRASALIIVGAGHLAGPDSVIDLLRKKGYPVTQM